MKTTDFKIGIAALAALFILASCNGESQSSKTENDHSQHQTVAERDNPQAPKTKNEALDALYPHYLALQEALVAGDISKAKEAGLLVEEAGKHVDGAKDLQEAASQVLSAENINSQRDAFSSLSNALIELIKTHGVATGEFYVAHCPMAFNDKGANWLSPTKSIKNPYFGDKMLNCGSVEETLRKL
ncbi:MULTISPECIES: DUF3347 domain-containing protein [Olivibacter]|jgi:hypothetical protein|uniref:DUF3347 domain-containing protein n=1 Tax=Olivibacter oleidegradans TaxID=760123 RepID=A0ABV6HI09_9SPHI|nr:MULTISPECIES: DUF3347 domain-containing protein [Olivibacter]QEL01396.1 DUF3347 domain-containing protein [Olivibacter sp. LS-1]